jgi:hypothetical protein
MFESRPAGEPLGLAIQMINRALEVVETGARFHLSQGGVG